MKRYFYVLFTFFIGVLVFYSLKVEAVMPLTGRTIIIDPGHGAEDPGTNYGNIYEKDINLNISLYLEEFLGSLGASVLVTRDGDYDLSIPNANYRKKSDFDNRIKMINDSNADLYLSIHLNYLSDSSYFGPQVFYNNDNKGLAEVIQKSMNDYTECDREIKKIPNDTYMYSKLKVPGVLIECGFLSNAKERNLLKTANYQKEIAKSISLGVLQYFSN
ncbi:MAG: N-acetylmuramoyl-L-alanine amidase CwlD [Firmicutes bacterium]|nr:N-acetylmuramoyl-L-alanine amidase CwlD [Bacillota bacterium]